jgi:polysaccharide export outer membrane protein
MTETGKAIRLTLVAALALAAAGCAGMPRSTPSLGDVQDASRAGSIQLIPVTAATLPALLPTQSGFPEEFTAAPEYPYERLGPGDRLQLRIWESGPASVFSGEAGASLGEVTIDDDGRIYVPYVGAVQVAGSSAGAIRDTIMRRLRKVVLRPQADVRVVERRSALVTVQGDAGKPGSYPIERGRSRLGSLLAEVAPTQKNPEIYNVALRRDGKVGQVRLSDLYRDPALDVALQPGDSIVISEVVENITVLGAAGLQGQVRIPERNFTVVDALGQARGLNPEAADPRAIFVMRAPAEAGGPPLVYQFDMRQPQSIALANRFVLRNEDALLISGAYWAQTRQVLSAFAQSMATVRSVATIPVP